MFYTWNWQNIQNQLYINDKILNEGTKAKKKSYDMQIVTPTE